MSIKNRFQTGTRNFSQKQDDTSHADCFVVNYDGSPASTAAMRQACKMASPHTDIVAVYLALVPHSQDLDANSPDRMYDARTVLTAATVNARIRGQQIKTDFVECRVKGPALVQYAAQHGNATIFIGVEQEELEKKQNPFAEYVQALAPSDVVIVTV